MKFLQIISTFGIAAFPGQSVFSQSSSTVPPPVDCTYSSPQFATLCRVEANLTADDTVTTSFVGHTADEVCDGDCRCLMGAVARGGRCGTRSDGAVFCKCDYGTDATSPLWTLGCLDPPFSDLRNNVCNPNGTADDNGACNSDCQCSHGYGNTGNHKCTVDNGQPGNTNSYCVCENATNLP